MFYLKERSIIEISGRDSLQFMQGLITNDVRKLENSGIIYGAMLSPQGRFWFDFFLILPKASQKGPNQKEDSSNLLLLDCHKSIAEALFKKLNLYKLRFEVEIKISDQFWQVCADLEGFNQNELTESDLNVGSSLIFQDPRHEKMGRRIYLKNQFEDLQIEQNSANQQLEDQYHCQRFSLKIAEGFFDLDFDQSFILQFGFDEVNAIDYKKGCYLGQETTARMHYRGEISKKIYHFQIIDSASEIAKFLAIVNQETSENPNNSENKILSRYKDLKGCEVFLPQKEKAIGKILSTVIHENQIEGLVLLKTGFKGFEAVNSEENHQKSILVNLAFADESTDESQEFQGQIDQLQKASQKRSEFELKILR